MRIIAYKTQTRDNKVLLEESTGDYVLADKLEQLFAFLLEPIEEKHLKVCWGLDTTVSPILKLMGKTKCIKLHKEHKCSLWPEDPTTRVFYIPSKVFSVEGIINVEGKNYRNKSFLYDLAQYFPELDEPDDLSMVQSLGEKLLYELKKMGLEPKKLTSPVAIYEECVMRDLDLPMLSDMPKEVAEYAYRCSGRLWIEAHQLGYWE